jgi:hypothetical protein
MTHSVTPRRKPWNSYFSSYRHGLVPLCYPALYFRCKFKCCGHSRQMYLLTLIIAFGVGLSIQRLVGRAI